MPAGSERGSGLPRRWRPLGTRLASWFFGGLFVAVCLAMWIGLGDLRNRFAPREVWTMVALVLALLACLHAMMRCRVDATADGVTVVNGYRRHDLPWASIVNVTMPPGAPWAVLDMVDGHTVSAMGIQGSDGDRAKKAVRELRALIEAQHPEG